MTEQIQEQISAFVDDELSDEESAFLVRRFGRDTAARSQFIRYSMIGAALRGDLLQPYPSVLRRRMAVAMDGTAPAVQRNRSAAAWGARYSRPLLGTGIAAAVAIAGLLVLRIANEPVPEADALSSSRAPAGQLGEPESYVVPTDLPGGGGVLQPIRLTNYLVHHGEYASSLSRTSVHSNVVGANDLPVADEFPPASDPEQLAEQPEPLE